MKNVFLFNRNRLATIFCFFACIATAKAQIFVVAGYEQTSTPGQYNILGTGLLSVTDLTYTPYNVGSTTPDPLSFTTISDNELTVNLGQGVNIANVVDLAFSNSTYTDVEVPYVGQWHPGPPLITVTSGETLKMGPGGTVVLVLAGGTYGLGGGGGNTFFVENGGSFDGFDGAGSSSLYYVAGASISESSGGGGGDTVTEVNSINQMNDIPEPSTWVLLLVGFGLITFWRVRGRKA